jgi:hypothetical protein
MTIPFETDDEIAALESFLQKSSQGPLSNAEGIDDLRTSAEGLLRRISSPVRTMIAGEFSAGKSTLTNLLVGERLIPTSVLASALPPIVFRHGAKVTASACWWAGREPQAFAGADFDTLMTVDPDYIVLTAPNPILKRVSIFDTPGTSDPDRESEVLIELSSRAEMIIWCTNAVQAWRESERHMWTQLSPAVTKNGLMAVTHVDLPSVRQGYGRIMARLVKEAGSLFHAILPIDSLSAIEAAPRGVVADDQTWTQSGGSGLVKGVMDLAASLRMPDLIAARELIASRLNPAMGQTKPSAKSQTLRAPETPPMPVAEVGTDPTGAPTRPKLSAAAAMEKPVPRATGGKLNPMAGLAKLKEKAQRAAELEAAQYDAADDDRRPQAEPVPKVAASLVKAVKGQKGLSNIGQHPLILDWQSKVDALIALVKEHPDPEESGFIQAASDTIMELLNAVSAPDVLQPETRWLLGQFQEALDTVIMMQVESGNDVLEDAAMLLLQLSRDLACIANESA